MPLAFMLDSSWRNAILVLADARPQDRDAIEGLFAVRAGRVALRLQLAGELRSLATEIAFRLSWISRNRLDRPTVAILHLLLGQLRVRENPSTSSDTSNRELRKLRPAAPRVQRGDLQRFAHVFMSFVLRPGFLRRLGACHSRGESEPASSERHNGGGPRQPGPEPNRLVQTVARGELHGDAKAHERARFDMRSERLRAEQQLVTFYACAK
jgi:hypothetical protein